MFARCCPPFACPRLSCTADTTGSTRWKRLGGLPRKSLVPNSTPWRDAVTCWSSPLSSSSPKWSAISSVLGALYEHEASTAQLRRSAGGAGPAGRREPIDFPERQASLEKRADLLGGGGEALSEELHHEIVELDDHRGIHALQPGEPLCAQAIGSAGRLRYYVGGAWLAGVESHLPHHASWSQRAQSSPLAILEVHHDRDLAPLDEVERVPRVAAS